MKYLLAGVAAVVALGSFFALNRPRVEVARATSSTALLQPGTWLPRTSHGRRLEPEGDSILHGAGQSEEASFRAYSHALAPATPVLMMRYADLRDDMPAFFAHLRGDLQQHPELLIPQIGLSMTGADARGHYERDVAAGSYDHSLDAMCDGLKSLHRPAFVRPGYEFNGPWNGYDAASYVLAFRRIADRLHQCSPQVAVVWDWSADAEVDQERGGAPAEYAPQRWQQYYPGDAYVDWWGLNLFTPDSIRSEATRRFLTEAEQHHSPVMIAEASLRGPRMEEGEEAIAQWFRPFFDLLRSSPNLRAFCYIDWDWRQYPQWASWGDARIETNPAVVRFYRSQVVSNPMMVDAKGRPATLQVLHVPEVQER